MTYKLIQKNEISYLECLPGMAPIKSEADALDLIALCGENGTERLMLHSEHLPPEFYDLKSGLAGDVLLKFTNYRIKVVLVTSASLVGDGRFAEMAMESNKGNAFGVFYARPDAEAWLLK